MLGYILETGVQMCYIGDVCGMPVAFVGLEDGKPVIKPPLLSWEM